MLSLSTANISIYRNFTRFRIAECATQEEMGQYSYSIKRPKVYTSDFREMEVNKLISTINLSRAKEEKTHGTSKNRRILS